nr:reverse transcriptase domain-containing protein [Tanacetum cinerariifolium]
MSRSTEPNPNVFSRIRRDRSESPRNRLGDKGRREGAVFKRLGVKEEMCPHTRRAATKVPGQEEPSQPRKRYHEGTSSWRTKPLSKSKDSGGGHSKSRLKKQKSSIEEDDLSQPWGCKEIDPFTPRFCNFDFSKKTWMPSHVKTYDGSDDPEDHLKIFQAAAKVEHWAMPTWCHMFNSSLTGSARVWFDDLPPDIVDSYDDLKKAFLANFLQQKMCIKDPIEILHIKQKEGESTKDFVQRFKNKNSAREIPVLLRTTNEASALLKWKASLDEQSQSRLSSWVGSNPCKNWMGIGCSNATANAQSVVTIIQIRNMSLIGTLLHLDTSSLQNLVTLSLPFNTLFGNIPSNLVNMSQLQTLDLSHNNFSGVIPPEIGMLKYVSHLHLNDNSLEGHIPDSIGNFTNLTLLYLHDNNLEGHIPDSIEPETPLHRVELRSSLGLTFSNKSRTMISPNEKDQPKAAKKGEAFGKEKAMATLMVQPWQRVARQRITRSFSPDSKILFAPLEEEDGAEGPMLIKAKI